MENPIVRSAVLTLQAAAKRAQEMRDKDIKNLALAAGQKDLSAIRMYLRSAEQEQRSLDQANHALEFVLAIRDAGGQ